MIGNAYLHSLETEHRAALNRITFQSLLLLLLELIAILIVQAVRL